MTNNDANPPYRFAGLLFCLVAAICVVPFLEEHAFSGIALDLMLTAILLFCVYSLSFLPRVRWWALGLALLNISEYWFLRANYVPLLHWIAYCSNLLFFLLVIAITARTVFTAKYIDTNVILGAICVYLLSCLTWAFCFGLIEQLLPGSFAYLGESLLPAEQALQEGRSALPNFIYFSLVTFTTLGYGDLIPISGAAKNLSALEAVMGQLYVAILLARLMGMYLQQERIIKDK